ncbi:hypothetical protein, partial [Holdemania massiliensis]
LSVHRVFSLFSAVENSLSTPNPHSTLDSFPQLWIMVDYVINTFIKGYFDMDKILITSEFSEFIPIFPKKVIHIHLSPVYPQ